jgi:hypothetical protein
VAYRFNGTSDFVKFAIAPLSGYSVGPVTMALLFKRNTLATFDVGISVINSGFSAHRALIWVTSGNRPRFSAAGLSDSSSASLLINDTSKWYLFVATWAGTGTPGRFHIHDGTSWVHGDGTANITGSGTVGGTDVLSVSSAYGADWMAGDVVCAGIKKATRTDGQVETLSPTSFQAWRDFGFDWLIGFDSSLESAGILQDQASPGTGDESSISGTSAVADPPGWSWTGATTYNGSATVSLTDTVTTAGRLTAKGASALSETVTVTTVGATHATVAGSATVSLTATVTTAGVTRALVQGVATVSLTATVTTVPVATLYASSATVETIAITTVASPNTIVMPPATSGDTLVLTPTLEGEFVLTPLAHGALIFEEGTNARTVTQTAHGLTVQDVVRLSSTSYVQAQANNASNAEVVGIVAEVPDANTFTVVSAGWLDGLSGLTPGALYYLSASSAGDMTVTEPATPGQISKPLLVADAATSGYWVNYRGRVVT